MLNIYCDESCHLRLTDNNQEVMAIGGITCNKDNVKEINEKIRILKRDYGINKAEIKWTKISNSKLEFYKKFIDLFFDEDSLMFRVIIMDKNKTNYDKYNHEDIYYIMYFYLLREMISTTEKNSIYVDKKDTNGGKRVEKLKECLCNQKMDFNHELIDKIQIVTSNDCELMQVTDILIGAVTYANRFNEKNEKGRSMAKLEIVRYIKSKTMLTLKNTVPTSYSKFNIFVWGEYRWGY